MSWSEQIGRFGRTALGLLALVVILTMAATASAERSWSAHGPLAGGVVSIASDPFQPETIFAGVDLDAQLLVSHDAGSSWQSTLFGTPRTIVFDPVSEGIIYIGTDGDILKSTDSGQTWSDFYIGDSIRSISIDPRNHQHLLANGTILGTLYSSADSGHTWVPILQQQPPPSQNLGGTFVRFDPVLGGTAYAGLQGVGFWKTSNNGTSWTPMNEGLPASISAQSFDIAGNGLVSTLWLGSDRGLFKSSDRGAHWAAVTGIASNTSIKALRAGLRDPIDLLVGTDQGLLESTDDGVSWSLVAALSKFPITSLESGHDGRIYAGTDGAGIFFRSFQGQWLNSPAALNRARCGRVFADPSSDSVMYAYFDRLYRSDDEGSTWLPTGGGPPPEDTHLTAMAGGTFFAVGTSYQTGQPLIQATRDLGQTWTALAPFPLRSYGGYILDLQPDPSSPQGLFLLLDNDLLRSSDLGTTWTSIGPKSIAGAPVNLYLTALLVDPRSSSIIHLSDGYLGMMKTIDGGSSWYAVNSGIPQVPDWYPGLACIGTDPAILYATLTPEQGCPSSGASWTSLKADSSTLPSFFYRSTDAGETWQPTGDPPGDIFGFVSVVDPTDPSHLYGGSLGGCYIGPGDAYESVDGGLNWALIERNLPRTHIGQLLISKDGARLYAATASGLLRYSEERVLPPITAESPVVAVPIHRNP